MKLTSVRYWCILCGLTATATAQAPMMGGGPRAHKPYVLKSNPLLGVIRNGSAFAVQKHLGKNGSDGHPLILHHASIRSEQGKLSMCKRYEFDDGSLSCAPFRWRVAHNSFWGGGSMPSYNGAAVV